jgi:hypothetical protein
MADGGWQMADGRWRMADGGWRMADGGWRMAKRAGEELRKRFTAFGPVTSQRAELRAIAIRSLRPGLRFGPYACEMRLQRKKFHAGKIAIWMSSRKLMSLPHTRQVEIRSPSPRPFPSGRGNSFVRFWRIWRPRFHTPLYSGKLGNPSCPHYQTAKWFSLCPGERVRVRAGVVSGFNPLPRRNAAR